MELFRRIFFAAVLSGAVAGLALAGIQQWRVVPLILEAELYEGEDHTHGDVVQTEAHDESVTHTHEIAEPAEPWSPADGFERTTYTILATTLVSMGFALMLGAISVFVGINITLANSVLWGLGGFVAFTMAPAFGLPPELPGMAAADLVARQIWWWGTALATGAALLGMAKFRTPASVAIGIALIAIPHLVGAPQPPDEHTALPAHLATAFAASTLTASMIFWMIMATLTGWLNERFGTAS